jgi:hypothetical protein
MLFRADFGTIRLATLNVNLPMSNLLSLEDKFFTVPAEATPTKRFKVKIRVPKVEDRLQSQSLFPGPDSQVGYTEAEYLLAQCLYEVNDNDLRAMPMDVIQRIEAFPYQDLQYLMAVFNGFVTFGSADEVDKLKKVADVLFSDPALEIFTISKEYLPSKTVSITFQTPRMKDRIKAQRLYPGRREAGYPFEEFMFGYCVTHLNGEPVHTYPAMDRLRGLYLLDYTHAAEVFYRLSVLNDQDFKNAESLGKQTFAEIFTPSKEVSTPSGTGTTVAKSPKTTVTPVPSTASQVLNKPTGTEA